MCSDKCLCILLPSINSINSFFAWTFPRNFFSLMQEKTKPSHQVSFFQFCNNSASGFARPSSSVCVARGLLVGCEQRIICTTWQCSPRPSLALLALLHPEMGPSPGRDYHAAV